MTVTRRKLQKLLSYGDVVYILCAGGYKEATVKEICDDCLDTDLDLLFFDEIRVTWCLHKSTAENITRQSQ